MAENDGDKTEAPTPRRRQEARQQGTIARSHDLTSSVLLIGGLLLMKWFGPAVILALRDIIAQLLSGPSLADLGTERIGIQLMFCLSRVATSVAPLFGGAMLLVILVNIAQVGLNFNPERVSLNLAALNPTRGFNKIFALSQSLPQLIMNLIKVTFVALAGWSAISSRLGQIVAAQQLAYLQIFSLAGDLVFGIGMRIGVLLLVLAIFDYIYQRFRIEKSLRMSKQEIKDEMRSMDGDPVMKNRRRQVAQQRAMQRLKKEVPKADVVVTNPTHFAVALKYDQSKMRAPRVIAKGADLMALRIRSLASDAGIPIIERAPLARAIYRMVDVGEEIPEELYAAVAEILAYVYELSGKSLVAMRPGVGAVN